MGIELVLHCGSDLEPESPRMLHGRELGWDLLKALGSSLLMQFVSFHLEGKSGTLFLLFYALLKRNALLNFRKQTFISG